MVVLIIHQFIQKKELMMNIVFLKNFRRGFYRDEIDDL